MKIHEIEEYFESSEQMQGLLNFLQEEYFDKIDYHADLFRGGALSDNGQVQNSIEELTGIFMVLNPIFLVADTIKKNREEAFYMARKIDIENRGDKFVSAPIDKEASSFVANERRVRNIIQGMLEACSQGISTCQSKMRFAGKEIELSK
jgi:hypothetical protein